MIQLIKYHYKLLLFQSPVNYDLFDSNRFESYISQMSNDSNEYNYVTEFISQKDQWHPETYL